MTLRLALWRRSKGRPERYRPALYRQVCPRAVVMCPGSPISSKICRARFSWTTCVVRLIQARHPSPSIVPSGMVVTTPTLCSEPCGSLRFGTGCADADREVYCFMLPAANRWYAWIVGVRDVFWHRDGAVLFRSQLAATLYHYPSPPSGSYLVLLGCEQCPAYT